MREALIERTYNQLSSINILKKEQIDNHFIQVRKDLELSFTHAFFLEHFYPAPTSALKPGGLSPEVKKEIESIQGLLGFRSIGVYTQADEIYSTASQPEIGKVVGRVKPDSEPKWFYVVDASDTAGQKATSLLYVIPLRKEPNPWAFIIVEEDFRKVQTILNENTGMGNTGESYVVGDDRRMNTVAVRTEPVVRDRHLHPQL